MIDDMPRPRPPHLHRETNRHGTVVWYFRKGKGPRIRIKAKLGTPEFDAAYQDALAGAEKPVAQKTRLAPGSLAWLVERYRETQEWSTLSTATRKQRENILRQVLVKAGDKPYRHISRKTIQDGINRRRATPFQAKHFLQAMRGLFRWAAEAHDFIDPTEGLKAETPKTEGFLVWTEEDVARFEARWPLGTRERLALDLLLYTGLRRGDVARLGRQHVKNGIITIRTAKTGAEVSLPILAPLAASITAAKTGALAFIARADGQPMVKEGFGNWFREACDKAGVKGSAHGLRKLGATRAADNGATESELEAIFGWSGGHMASLYTRTANRRRLAIKAMGKLEQVENIYSRTSMSEVPAPSKKES